MRAGYHRLYDFAVYLKKYKLAHFLLKHAKKLLLSLFFFKKR
jgi:hypothetical protein